MELLRGGAYLKKVRLMGACPQREYWDFSHSSSYLFASQLP
jgi:hypothetical protein